MNGTDPYLQVPPQQRRSPHSDLDLNLMLTDPVVGTENVNPYLQDRLKKEFYIYDENGNVLRDENGNPLVNKESMWEKLNFYTRDLRLGNLKGDEVTYCQWYLDFAGDCLQENYYKAFIIALARAITVIELSQSRSGFLRKQPNTLRTENVSGELEPNKKSLFAGKKQ